MMYFLLSLFLFSFGALYSGQTFCVYMRCTDIDYCIYDFCGLWTVFMVMCLWICIYGYVFGYVYGYRVSILREARFNKHRGLPLLGARLHRYWDLLFHEARFYHHWVLLLHEAHFNKFWVLLLHEAHFNNFFGSYSFTRPIWMTLRIFPIFSDKKWKNLPQYVVSNKFF